MKQRFWSIYIQNRRQRRQKNNINTLLKVGEAVKLESYKFSLFSPSKFAYLRLFFHLRKRRFNITQTYTDYYALNTLESLVR